MRWAAACLVALVALSCGTDGRSELRVFAAASLVDVFADLEDQFESDHPDVDVVIQAGGSTQLATQINEGAPADVFAAANEAAMGLVTDSPDAVFATNRLVIATPPGNPGGVERLEDLADGDLVIAVCAPVVPCGALAEAVLEDQGVDLSPDTEEPNVRAVLNKVVLDEVDAGLVYLSDALAAGDSVRTIDIGSTRSNNYPVVSLSESDPAAEFVALILSAPAAALLEEAGFGAP